MRFSQRVGNRPPFTSGLAEATQNLRTATWNVIHVRLFPERTDSRKTFKSNAKQLWNHLHWRTDEIPVYAFEATAHLKNRWFSWEWPEFFDALEFCTFLLKPPEHRGDDVEAYYLYMNGLLEAEGCAYRFIAQELAPITNTIEMTEVVAATECAVESASQHIREALSLLPPNPNSSGRNSVKESISAVEAALKHLTGETAATLGQALRAYEGKYAPLHASIRRGLDHLYAYSNGKDGIRHALVDDAAEVTVDDARFMVVTCSAFVNYLIALSETKVSDMPTN